MKLLILLAMISVPTLTSAFTSDDLLHPVAHGAGSYLLTHAGQVVCKKITGLNKTTCSIISGVVTMAIGVAVEATQEQAKGNYKKGLVYDISGVILAVGVIHLDF